MSQTAPLKSEPKIEGARKDSPGYAWFMLAFHFIYVAFCPIGKPAGDPRF